MISENDIEPLNEYRYLGDKLTEAKFKGATCYAVRKPGGKCVRGKNGTMLVRFTLSGETCVVIGRLLRKIIV